MLSVISVSLSITVLCSVRLGTMYVCCRSIIRSAVCVAFNQSQLLLLSGSYLLSVGFSDWSVTILVLTLSLCSVLFQHTIVVSVAFSAAVMLS